MNMSYLAETFSVWLRPQRSDYVDMARLIAGLNEIYGTSKFEPHLTLYSGMGTDRDSLRRAVAEQLAGLAPITLKIDGVRASAEFFKTLFIEFGDSPVLNDLHRKIKAGLKQDSGYTLRPHLSLMYMDLELDLKWEIARTINVINTEIVFDEIMLVSPGNKALGWKDIANWEVWFKHPLNREYS
jgi:putative hydrolase of the HAD superfamily